jgi:GNAT superfamily N-acetyltransferase
MYTIENASSEELECFIEMAKYEGWNPGLSDAKAFFDADPKGFFIGKLNGEKISCISAVKYGDFGFIGLYIVKEPFRGKGYGLEIWNKAIEYLGDINVALDGVPAQIENYKKSGFKLYHGSLRFAGHIPVGTNGFSNIISARELQLSEIIAYDRFHFPGRRDEFIKGWLYNDCHYPLLWHQNNSGNRQFII